MSERIIFNILILLADNAHKASTYFIISIILNTHCRFTIDRAPGEIRWCRNAHRDARFLSQGIGKIYAKAIAGVVSSKLDRHRQCDLVIVYVVISP